MPRAGQAPDGDQEKHEDEREDEAVVHPKNPIDRPPSFLERPSAILYTAAR